MACRSTQTLSPLAPVIDADDEQSSVIGDDSDHNQPLRFPVDHPLIGVHSARVIFPQSDSQLQSRSLSGLSHNIDQFEAIAMVTAITWLTMELLVKLVKEGLCACVVFDVSVCVVRDRCRIM